MATTTDRELDDALDASFPASDPPAATTPVAATASNDVLPASPGGATGGMVRMFRVVEDWKAAAPFNGKDSSGGGRWTSPSVPGVYAALSPAGALLEFLAHLEGQTPSALVMVVAAIPAEEVLVQCQLLEDWNQRPYRAHVRAIGDAWSASRKSLALRVPSALCPDECNILINPGHENFGRIVIERIVPIRVDERIRS